MALRAASKIASNPVAQPAAAAAAQASGFAAFVAKLNPKTAAQPQAAPKTDNPNSDVAAALAAMQNATPLPASANAAGNATAPSDDGKPFAALRAVDPAQLRATPDTQAPAIKPGMPSLPVMPVAGDADNDSDATDDAAPSPGVAAATKPTSAADIAQAALHLSRPTTPAQSTEAQALSTSTDGKADSQHGGANADTGGQSAQDGSQNNQTSNDAPQAATQPAAHSASATAPAAPAQTAATNSAALAASNAANGAAVSTATAIQPTSATLHVTPATQAASAQQPDIAALAVTIAAKSQDGAKHFDIRLDPPEFGRIDVRMSVDDSGKAQAHLTADKPQTLELLQRDSGTLQRALKDSGVDVGNSGLQFSLRGGGRQGGGEDQTPSRGSPLAVTASVAAPTTSTWSLASDSARLDIRV